MTAPAAPAPTGRPTSATLQRRRSGRLMAGVAGGVADHLGADVLWVRAAFVALTAVSGAGVVAYGLLWVFVRQEDAGVDAHAVRGASASRRWAWPRSVWASGWRPPRWATRRWAGSSARWASWSPGPRWCGARPTRDSAAARAAPAGAGWRSGWRAALLRVVAGVLFVAAGIAVFLVGNLDMGQVQFGLLAVLATLAGVAVITVPWWVRLVRDLGEERRERIREAERAEIAAHLHDSVLQTLALIQRQSDSPREVLRLARGQERELRTWLYGARGYRRGGAADDPTLGAGLTEALATAAAEVEDTYALTVRPVVVGGDRPLDDGLRALVLAAREAMVNAAKHAGVDEVSVYVEVEPDEVNVFVRDRGAGFDPDAVPDDRHGLADSVRGRMERHGGKVRLRTRPGEGTEVHLCLPLGEVEHGSPAAAEQASAEHAAAEHAAAQQKETA